jgi:hypothetical protein
MSRICFIASCLYCVPQFSHSENSPPASIINLPPQISHRNFAIAIYLHLLQKSALAVSVAYERRYLVAQDV